MLLIRLHHITRTGKNAGKKSMIEVLFIIMITYCFPQKCGHLTCELLAITTPNSIKKLIAIPFFCTVIKPLDYGSFKNLFNLSIWNHKSKFSVLELPIIIVITYLCQIPSQIEHAPKIILRRMKIIICQALINSLNYAATSH